MTYDGGTGATASMLNGTLTESRADAGERWAVGFYGGYEHIINRFGAFVDVGYRVVGEVARCRLPAALSEVWLALSVQRSRVEHSGRPVNRRSQSR